MFKTLSSLLSAFLFFSVIIIIVIMVNFWRITQSLPDYMQLEKYEPPVTTRLFAGDGQLLMEYATEQRLFVPVDKMPELVKNAFIAAEDKKFYTHTGVDFVGIVRAILDNLKKIGTGRRPAGASTITQQVAKNFLLSSELSYVRKIKEAILSWKIEKSFSKNHILELYLNQIFLGNRSYGVAAAALNYFDKSLDELSVEEAAFLAALPKGPNNYNPKTKYEAAIARRNWVIGRMLEDGYVDEYTAENAKSKPIVVKDKGNRFIKDGGYFSEEVRREIEKSFGKEALNEGGLIVRTTVDPRLQEIATKVFQEELISYDIRHGWRGPIEKIELDADYLEKLKKVEVPLGAPTLWKKAVVLEVGSSKAMVSVEDGTQGQIPLTLLSWAKKNLPDQAIGYQPKTVSEVLHAGDVVLVEKVTKEKAAKQNLAKDSYELRQMPNIEGGLIAIDAHTGRVLAMVGGFSFRKSQFNRTTQAKRQTGSSFKPFVYLAALESGYSPTDLILDAPFVLDQGPGLPKWKPKNYSKKFYGLMTLREGVEKSRNLMTVRLAQDLGMEKISSLAQKIGVNEKLPKLLSMSLGAGDTVLQNITAAYASIVNGGKRVDPYVVERIQDRFGKTIFKHDSRGCNNCNFELWNNQQVPELVDDRKQVLDPMSAYQMTSILEGAAVRGTAAALRRQKRHLAGKTGTTNESKDAWFIGFSSDLVVGTYIGFDEPRTLGKRETGSSAALPIFARFMEEALKNQPDIPFRIPSGMKLVRVNYETGKPAVIGDEMVIYEALKPEIAFDNSDQKVIQGNENDEELAEVEAGNFKTLTNSLEEDDIQLGSEY